MSASNEIYDLINQMYTAELIMRSLRVRPREYVGVSLFDNETHTLEVIADNEGISQVQLSEKMFRTKGATSVMVDKLIEKGLVIRQRIDDDRRRYVLTLTEKGKAVHQAHVSYDFSHAEAVAEALKEDEDALHKTNEILGKLIRFHVDYQKKLLDTQQEE